MRTRRKRINSSSPALFREAYTKGVFRHVVVYALLCHHANLYLLIKINVVVRKNRTDSAWQISIHTSLRQICTKQVGCQRTFLPFLRDSSKERKQLNWIKRDNFATLILFFTISFVCFLSHFSFFTSAKKGGFAGVLRGVRGGTIARK